MYPAFDGGNKTIAPSSNQRYFEALWVIPMKILLSLITLAAMADIVIALPLPKANPVASQSIITTTLRKMILRYKAINITDTWNKSD
ncbi:MAG: hypothetical protein ACXW03_05630 [Methylobacter sp.]